VVEEWSVLESTDGTRVAWTMAIDASAPVLAVLRAGGPGAEVATRRALARLDQKLA